MTHFVSPVDLRWIVSSTFMYIKFELHVHVDETYLVAFPVKVAPLCDLSLSKLRLYYHI